MTFDSSNTWATSTTSSTQIRVFKAWCERTHGAESTGTGTLTTTGSLYSTNIWASWTGGSSFTMSTLATTTSSNLWPTWNRVQTIRPRLETPVEAERRAQVTAQLVAQQRGEEERWKKVQAEEAAKRKIAEDRAKVLLMECLSDPQRETLEKHGWFDVKIPDGRMFRIHKGYQHNVRRLDGGKEREDYCAHIDLKIPVYDNMLAQKLTLQHNPEEFFKLANVAVRYNREGVARA